MLAYRRKATDLTLRATSSAVNRHRLPAWTFL